MSPRKIRPEVTRSSPARQCSSVDFPDPDGPMIAVYAYRANSTSIPSSARTSAPPEAEAALGPHEHAEQRKAIERLVEKRGMERRVLLVAAWSVAEIDLDGPRQRRRLAEQLLVEPVAESADGLRNRDPGCHGIH